jgi:hypothetical protein
MIISFRITIIIRIIRRRTKITKKILFNKTVAVIGVGGGKIF